MPTLQEMRRAAFLTQADVAKQLDVAPSTIYQWEQGKKRPRLRYIPLLAALYHVTPQQIQAAVEQNAPAKHD